MNYSADIDKNNLDEEAITIPSIFDAFAIKEAEASERWDALKDKLKVVQADVSLKIRGMSIEQINFDFNLQLIKLTEEVFKQLVYIHPEVIEVYNKIAEARYETRMYSAAKQSIQEKAARLDNLTKLHGQGYFMKIEGRPYRKIGFDTILDKSKLSTISRLNSNMEQKITKSTKTPKNLKSNNITKRIRA